MSNLAVFAVGLLVTLLVAAAMSLLLWGAVLDGREDDRHRAELGHTDAAAMKAEAIGADGLRLGPLAAG